jgi:hypothetical protein
MQFKIQPAFFFHSRSEQKKFGLLPGFFGFLRKTRAYPANHQVVLQRLRVVVELDQLFFKFQVFKLIYTRDAPSYH